MKKTYTLTAVVFLVFIFGLAVFLLTDVKGIGRSVLTAWRSADGGVVTHLDAATDSAEEALSASLRRGNTAVELYGGLLRLTAKRVSEDTSIPDYSVARLDNGAITFVNLDTLSVPDQSEAVEEIAGWAEALEEADIPLLFAAYPKKTARSDSGLPAGLSDWPVLKMTALAEGLAAEGVPVLDLRDSFEALGDYSDLFFRTDHHWNIRGGLFAYQTIAQTLREDYGLPLDEFYEDASNYHSEILEDWFLGSQGKRVGTLFGGTDDFELLTPGFDTSFTFSIPSQGLVREGSMEETILFPERVAERDYYSGNPYTYYSGGDYDLLTIENHLNPDGPAILLVRDSMACAVTPFLALGCSTLTQVDTRYYEGDVADLALELRPDLVLVMRG